jgi:leucyl aminopeptidase
MKFEALDQSFLNWTGDGLAIGLFDEQVELTGDAAQLDTQLSGLLRELISEADFKGKAQSTLFSRVTGQSFKKLIIVGLGTATSSAVPPPPSPKSPTAKSAKSSA